MFTLKTLRLEENSPFELVEEKSLAVLDSFLLTVDRRSHVELKFTFVTLAAIVFDPSTEVFLSIGFLFFSDFLFTGDPLFQINTDGTAAGFKILFSFISDGR